MINVKVLPGAEEFSELRQGKYYYVDKTDFLNRFFSPSHRKWPCSPDHAVLEKP